MSKTITLNVSDVDNVIVDELKYYYHLNNRWDRIDLSNDYIEPNYEVLKALLVVLSEYMCIEEFEEWSETNPILKENPYGG